MKEIVVSNGLYPIITQALEEMKSEQGDSFRLEEVNLSELERRTGISRAKLRRLKKDGFKSAAAEFTRVPQNTIEITDEKIAVSIMRLLGRLEEHDDVQNVYANFDIPDELMESLNI